MAINKPQLKNARLMESLAHLYSRLTSDKERTLEIQFVLDMVTIKCVEVDYKLAFECNGASIEIRTYDAKNNLLQTCIGTLTNMGGIEDHIIKTFDL